LGRQDWEDKIGKTRLGRQDWEDKIGKTRLIGLIIFEVEVKVEVEVEEIEKARLRRLGRQD